MFEQIKERLLEQPESIEHILSTFGFDKIRIDHKEIRCAYESGSNPTAVVIRLQDNENLFVKDYGRNLSLDLINYLVKSKNIPFQIDEGKSIFSIRSSILIYFYLKALNNLSTDFLSVGQKLIVSK